jgi:ribosomal protein S27E
VLTLLAQGPAQTTPTLPVAVDVMRADALRAKARELQAQGQLGHALAALAEALKANAADAASYAQIGHVLMAARAPEDAAHHFLLAYMLAPKEPQIGRLTIHASWALGYVGWAFQVAQAVYKLQPTQEWVEMGRAAMAWLKSSRPPGHTLLCTACRTMAIRPEHGPCPRCGGATMGAPANDAGFIGLRLMQQSPPTGRLFVGAACAGCYAETVVLVKPGGTRCPYCQEALLAPVPA